MEQIVDVPGSSGRGGRISERIVEQTIDVLGSSERATSSAAGSRQIVVFFRTFPREKKCDKQAAVDCEHAVALSAVHGRRP